MSSAQAEKFLLEETEVGRRWWIAPRTSQGPSSSVKDRLVQAIKGLNEAVQDKDFLIQIWVPIQQEGKNFLTTLEQPHFFNPKYSSLKRYRDISVAYNFPADGDSKDSVGLPGRVFLWKLPEWTPDVRFFRSEEYLRIKEAEKCDVRGSLALPVFERGSGTCLGVVEIVTTTQKMNYRPELDTICKALEVITLCERLAGQDANVTTVPVSVLRVTRQLTRFFQWTNDVADRLAFSEVLSSDTVFSAPMTETNSLLGVDQKDMVTLEKYLQDYFSNILKKLKDLKAQSKQSDIYF